ncbi:MAG: methyltransferase domain-containing protein [Xenococcaceae cyanobacterium]
MASHSTQQGWNAPDYGKNSQAQLQWAKELMTKLNLKGNESLLDIGCGEGKIPAEFASWLTEGFVVGIDASRSMIELAQQSYSHSTYPNLTFQQMDARNLELEQKFDVAFSNAALHWIDNHIAVLEGVRRHLNLQGKILFQMGGKGNVKDLFPVINELIDQPEWKPYFFGFSCPYYFYDIEDYWQWLSETGFKPLRVELIPKDMQHQGKEGLKGWLRTTWFPYINRLPEPLREKFLNAIVDTYTQIYPIDERGFTHVEMSRLEVEAEAS